MSEGGIESARLPLELKVIDIDAGECTIATESGHLFRLPPEIIDRPVGEAFRLDPTALTTASIDETRPAMARALINEIIGAPMTTRVNDAKKIRKIG